MYAEGIRSKGQWLLVRNPTIRIPWGPRGRCTQKAASAAALTLATLYTLLLSPCSLSTNFFPPVCERCEAPRGVGGERNRRCARVRTIRVGHARRRRESRRTRDMAATAATNGSQATADLPSYIGGPRCSFPAVLNWRVLMSTNALLLLLAGLIVLVGTVHRRAEEREVTSIRQWRLLLKPPPPKVVTELRATVSRAPTKKAGKGKGRR